MEGRRFGVGLAAGLVLGLAIITASGSLTALQGAFASPQSLVTQAGAGATTQTATNTLTVSSTQTETTVLSAATTTGGQPQYPISGNGTKTVITSTTQSNPSPAPVAGLLTNLFGSVNGGSIRDASRMASIAQQPVSTDLVVFIPLALAFLLGAALYLASNRRNREPDGEGT